jgi:hypothetical protein
MERNVKSHLHPRSDQDPRIPSTVSKLTNQPTLRAEDAASEEIGNISAFRQAQMLYARAKGMPQRPPNPGCPTNAPSTEKAITKSSVAIGMPDPVLAMTWDNFPHSAHVAGVSLLDQRFAPE